MELPFKELTHKIIGCAMEVHRVLGPGVSGIYLSSGNGYRVEGCSFEIFGGI